MHFQLLNDNEIIFIKQIWLAAGILQQIEQKEYAMPAMDHWNKIEQ